MDVVTFLRTQWDRVGAWVLVAVGLLALLLGWIGVSGQAYPAKQLPFMMSGGVGGVFLLGVGALFWLSSDLRDEWTKLDRIEEALVRLAGTELVEPEALAASEPPAPASPPVAVLAKAGES